MYEMIRFIVLFFVFLGLAVSVAMYFYFYRKYTKPLADAFQLLQQRQYINSDDYLFYEQLGMPGFAFRVILMKKILRCKSIKRSDGQWLDPEAGKLLLSRYDFSWVTAFYKSTIFVACLMFILIVLVITGS